MIVFALACAAAIFVVLRTNWPLALSQLLKRIPKLRKGATMGSSRGIDNSREQSREMSAKAMLWCIGALVITLGLAGNYRVTLAILAGLAIVVLACRKRTRRADPPTPAGQPHIQPEEPPELGKHWNGGAG